MSGNLNKGRWFRQDLEKEFFEIRELQIPLLDEHHETCKKIKEEKDKGEKLDPALLNRVREINAEVNELEKRRACWT